MDDFLDIDVEKESCPAGGVHTIEWIESGNANITHAVCLKCKTHGSTVCGVLCDWGKTLTEQEWKIVVDKIRRRNIKKSKTLPAKHDWEKTPDGKASRCKRCGVAVSSNSEASVENRVALIDMDEDSIMPWCFLPGEEEIWEVI